MTWKWARTAWLSCYVHIDHWLHNYIKLFCSLSLMIKSYVLTTWTAIAPCIYHAYHYVICGGQGHAASRYIQLLQVVYSILSPQYHCYAHRQEDDMLRSILSELDYQWQIMASKRCSVLGSPSIRSRGASCYWNAFLWWSPHISRYTMHMYAIC